jgi:hypothetical protein
VAEVFMAAEASAAGAVFILAEGLVVAVSRAAAVFILRD